MNSNWIINYTVELTEGARMLDHRYMPLMVPGDSKAHTINVTVLQNGKKADLSGATITGYFALPNDTTIPVRGSRSDNIATVTLLPECYSFKGPLRCVIRASKADNIVTLMDAMFMIQQELPQSYIDPSSMIPRSVESLLEYISILEQATTNAQAVVDGAEQYIEAAETYAQEANDSASDASAAAIEAHADAENAAASAAAAQQSADTATDNATAAQQSAEAAQLAAESAEAIAIGDLARTFVHTYEYTDDQVLTKIKRVDGDGSKLDADLLDDHEGSYYTNAENIDTGILPVNHGGTGRNALPAGYLLEGSGTDSMRGRRIANEEPAAGSTDVLTSGLAYAALIGKADNTIHTDKTLTASNWNSTTHTQVINWSSLKSYSTVTVALALNVTAGQAAQAAYAQIQPTTLSDGSITFKAYGSVPTVDIPIAIYVSGIDGTEEATTVATYATQIEQNTANMEELADRVETTTKNNENDILDKAGTIYDSITFEKDTTVDIHTDHSRTRPSELMLYGRFGVEEEVQPVEVYDPVTDTSTWETEVVDTHPVIDINGYDSKIIFDGSENWSYSPPQSGNGYFQFTAHPTLLPSATSIALATESQLPSYGIINNPITAVADDCIYVSIVKTSSTAANVRIGLPFTAINTVEAFKGYLNAHPLTIWYKSTELACAREIYLGVQIEDGDGCRGYAVGPMAPLFGGDTVDLATGTVKRTKDLMLLDGDEHKCALTSTGVFITTKAYGESSSTNGLCSHYGVSVGGSTAEGTVRRYATNGKVYIRDSSYNGDLSAFNAYLAAQYANHHPVRAVFNRNNPMYETVPVSEQVSYRGNAAITITDDGTITFSKDLDAFGFSVQNGRLCVTFLQESE